MATPEEHVDRLRLDLADPRLPNEGSEPDSDSLWSDAELYAYLNEAQNEFARKTRCFPDATSFTSAITATDPWVTLDSRIAEIREGYLASNSLPITVANRNEVGQLGLYDDYGIEMVTNSTWRTRTGTPAYVVLDMEPNKGRLVPIPTSDDTVNWEVWRFPLNPIEDDLSTFEIDEQWHYVLLYYAMFKAYSKQDAETVDMRRAGDFKAVWDLEIDEVVMPFFSRKIRRVGVTRYGGL